MRGKLTAPITQKFADEIGADGYSENAPGAVHLARRAVELRNPRD